MTGFCSYFGWHLVDKRGTVCRGKCKWQWLEVKENAQKTNSQFKAVAVTQAAAVWLCDRGLDGAQSQCNQTVGQWLVNS